MFIKLTFATTLLAAVLVASSPAVGWSFQDTPTDPQECGWSVVISGAAGNGRFIDQAATYWTAAVPIEESGSLEVAGEFPHARFMSLEVYDQRLRTIDHTTDVEIEPDQGSTNPFLPGADRTTIDRSFTLRVIEGSEPASGASVNTLYTESADGQRSSLGTGVVRVTLRVYAPDAGTDDTGGVGLPRLTRVDSGGATTPLIDCLPAEPPYVAASPNFVIPGGRGSDPPAWDRFLPNGYGENTNADYVFETYMPSLGEVLALRAAAPTAPATREAEPTMGDGDVRYWSMCNHRMTGALHECINDEDVPRAEDGSFTIVVSSAQDRPANARPECGVAWLEAAAGEEMLLVYRQLIPDDAFAPAIRHAAPGQEQAVLGSYYPAGTYSDGATFDQAGCQPPPSTTEPRPDTAGARSDKAAAPNAGTGSSSSSIPWVGVAAIGGAAAVVALVVTLRRRYPRRSVTEDQP